MIFRDELGTAGNAFSLAKDTHHQETRSGCPTRSRDACAGLCSKSGARSPERSTLQRHGLEEEDQTPKEMVGERPGSVVSKERTKRKQSPDEVGATSLDGLCQGRQTTLILLFRHSYQEPASIGSRLADPHQLPGRDRGGPQGGGHFVGAESDGPWLCGLANAGGGWQSRGLVENEYKLLGGRCLTAGVLSWIRLRRQPYGPWPSRRRPPEIIAPSIVVLSRRWYLPSRHRKLQHTKQTFDRVPWTRWWPGAPCFVVLNDISKLRFRHDASDGIVSPSAKTVRHHRRIYCVSWPPSNDFPGSAGEPDRLATPCPDRRCGAAGQRYPLARRVGWGFGHESSVAGAGGGTLGGEHRGAAWLVADPSSERRRRLSRATTK